MPVAWRPNRWWDWFMSDDEKKEIDPMSIKELQKCVSVVRNMGVLKHFVEECVGSIQLGVIETFWSIRTFYLKNLI